MDGLAQANIFIGHEEFKEGLWNALGEYDDCGPTSGVLCLCQGCND